MDVVALKTPTLRGQAWIVFEDIACATRAMKALQGFPFCDKPMRIAFAKSKSRAVEIEKGTYTSSKRFTTDKGRGVEKKKKIYVGPPPSEETEKKDRTRKATDEASAKPAGDGEEVSVETGTRGPIIMCSELPERACKKDVLGALFKQFSGLLDIRVVEGKRLAFVEFDSPDQSAVALEALQNFRLTANDRLKLSYAA